MYGRLSTPTRIIVVKTGLAMRGAIIDIGEKSMDTPGGAIHTLEWYARKQRRVTGSTFSAELNAASEACEFGKLMALTIAELSKQYSASADLLKLKETGAFPVAVEMVIDARSVYDALIATEIKAPTEISLIMFLCQLKEAMLTHSLSRLWWCDTHDMISNGLNQGACTRQKLVEVCEQWPLGSDT